MKAALPVLAGALALAACSSPDKRPAAAAPAPVARPATARPAAPPALPAPAMGTAWMDAPLTSGGWRHESDAAVSRAIFGDNPFRPALVMACERRQGLIGIAVRGTPPGPRTITILTETNQRAVTGTDQPEVDGVSAFLDPRDPLLDAMALSKGRFAVIVEGAATLIVPSWAEVSRVIEDCRG